MHQARGNQRCFGCRRGRPGYDQTFPRSHPSLDQGIGALVTPEFFRVAGVSGSSSSHMGGPGFRAWKQRRPPLHLSELRDALQFAGCRTRAPTQERKTLLTSGADDHMLESLVISSAPEETPEETPPNVLTPAVGRVP